VQVPALSEAMEQAIVPVAAGAAAMEAQEFPALPRPNPIIQYAFIDLFSYSLVVIGLLNAHTTHELATMF